MSAPPLDIASLKEITIDVNVANLMSTGGLRSRFQITKTFSASSVNLVIKDAKLDTIPVRALEECHSLARIDFSGCPKLKTIQKEAFSECTKVVQIILPPKVASIGEHAFSNCESLTSLTLPSKLQTISDGLFTNCESLLSITIPDTVTRIGMGAFAGCEAFSSLVLPPRVASVGDLAFQGF